MSTTAQIAANRRNSLHSTGPATSIGKAAAAQNNFRHGLRGHFNVLPNEDAEEFLTLLNGLREEHQPATVTGRILVDRMAEHEWLSRRAQVLIDAAMLAGNDTKALSLWLRYQTAHHRGFHKCLADLLKLRNEMRKEQIGFERQKRDEAESARKQEVAEARIRTLNAQASLRELDTELKSMFQAPIPGNTPIDFTLIKPFLNQAIDQYLQAQALGVL